MNHKLREVLDLSLLGASTFSMPIHCDWSWFFRRGILHCQLVFRDRKRRRVFAHQVLSHAFHANLPNKEGIKSTNESVSTESMKTLKLLLREDAKRQLWRNEIEQKQLQLHCMMKAIGTSWAWTWILLPAHLRRNINSQKCQSCIALKTAIKVRNRYSRYDAQVPKHTKNYDGVSPKQRNSRNLKSPKVKAK